MIRVLLGGEPYRTGITGPHQRIPFFLNYSVEFRFRLYQLIQSVTQYNKMKDRYLLMILYTSLYS